jgi:hypothetical protein
VCKYFTIQFTIQWLERGLTLEVFSGLTIHPPSNLGFPGVLGSRLRLGQPLQCIDGAVFWIYHRQDAVADTNEIMSPRPEQCSNGSEKPYTSQDKQCHSQRGTPWLGSRATAASCMGREVLKLEVDVVLRIDGGRKEGCARRHRELTDVEFLAPGP